MAEAGRTVRVSGLPTDVEDGRLKDKLLIHFLRSRNGGGEIDSVIIDKAPPVSALITFEDSRAAQRVIQLGRHTLDVDERKYVVTVTEHRENLDPDKVILGLSAMVDCRQLPGGVMTLKSLHKSHPDIQIHYDTTEELYTLHGAYSKVQAALAQLLGHPGGSQSAENKDTGQSASSGSTSVQAAEKPHLQESEDQSRKAKKQKEQREQREKVDVVRPSDEHNAGSHTDLTADDFGREEADQAEGPSLQPPDHPATPEEDFFLIVDADMYQYLQKHCRKEYQRIISQYGVEVVDVTTQGLTSLFLQLSKRVVGDDGRDQECLKLAKKALSSFFQENETKIRRAQLPKSILSLRGRLQRVKENLSVRFPKVLLDEDDQNIYIIGISSDVSEAKLFLLDYREGSGEKEDVASLLRFPSYDSGSSEHADEQRSPHTMAGSLDDPLLRSEEDERRAEGARRYKLAARFKDTGLPALGSRPTDFSFRGGLSSPSRQTRPGPMLGHDVLSEPAEVGGERLSRAQNTGGDILFKSGDGLPSAASMQNKTSLTDTRPKSLTSPLSTAQSSLSGGTPLPPPGSGSALRRTSSFSGTPQQKAEVMGQKSQDDSAKSAVRARVRSSSFSNQPGRERGEVYTAEIILSPVLWRHIKEAFSTLVEDLTSDVQVKESRFEGSRDRIVTLRGANSSKVSSCQQSLQKLIDSVSADFSVHEVRLSELGITDTADENLRACCAEVRSRFKKVTIQILKTGLLLLGPNQLCSQVGDTLREIFSADLAQMPEQQDFSSPSTSNWNQFTVSQTNEDQSRHRNPQVMQESQTSKGDGTGGGQERRAKHRSDLQETELMNGSISQPSVRKDPVVKEKVRIVGTTEMDGQQTETLVNHSKTGNDKSSRHVNGVWSEKDVALHKKERTAHSAQKGSAQQSRTEIQDSPQESRPGLGGPGSMCICGKRENLMGTKCGAIWCSKCLDVVHVHCKVCHKTEQTPRGIRGKMSYSLMHNISVPGHKNDSAIKITYCIPDGVQEEGHPSPGNPFQGGTFEAFLPDNETARKLLLRLEKAFHKGLTFTVTRKDAADRVTWDCIPHKTSLQGGKTGNGYPDSSYLSRLSSILTSNGIMEPPVKSKE